MGAFRATRRIVSRFLRQLVPLCQHTLNYEPMQNIIICLIVFGLFGVIKGKHKQYYMVVQHYGHTLKHPWKKTQK